MGKATPDDREAALDDQIEDSFPASDPPSSNAGKRVGQPDRARKDPSEPIRTPNKP